MPNGEAHGLGRKVQVLSGEIHVISGELVGKISGEILTAKVSGEQVRLEAYDYESEQWRRVRSTTSGEIAISITVADIVTAKVSGETVIAKVSGETLVAKVSGETVKVSGEIITAKVSGEPVTVSGDIVTAKVSGEVVKISGEKIYTYTPTQVKTGPLRIITAASGGEVLHSGAVESAIVKAIGINSGDIFIGGSVNRPYSGYGFACMAGEAVSLDVNNFDAIYVVANVSGDRVTFQGIA